MIIDELEKAAETEGYNTDEVKETIATLRSQLKHNLNHDLDIHREEISRYIANEIMQRYYFDEGVIQQSLRNDKEIAKALEILADPAAYRAILAPKDKN